MNSSDPEHFFNSEGTSTIDQSNRSLGPHVPFTTLGNHSRTFLGIASFLRPENIPQLLFDLEKDKECDLPEAFLRSNRASLDAFPDQTRQGFSFLLLSPNGSNSISTSAPPAERQKAFNNAVALVYHVFPKQSDENNQNQLYHQWNECNYFLQHVLTLKNNFKEERRHTNDFHASFKFRKLLQDCQRYLYETNAVEELKDVCEVNLLAVETIDNSELATDIRASTLSHQASMYKSTGGVHKAIELNIKGYSMRLGERPLKGGLLGGFEQNLGYSYNTANDHHTALTWLERSRDTWIASNVKQGREADWPTVTTKNIARCFVYLGHYDKARELLDIAIYEFKLEKPLNWAMLAYAYFVLGTLERYENRPEAAEASFIEAENLWYKGDQTKLHPFNAVCLYKAGVVCLHQGKVEAAINHICDSLEITKFHANVMPVEHTRGLFKLSEALLHDSCDSEEAEVLRGEAELYLLRDPQAVNFEREEDYDQWVPIFWR
ncbi:hypothetical protein AARAC_003611 [Aspergillus arachidicola]|uniref:Tetratricopeptide repeat domain protein n=1 Tax=Aspergillus arachidicola TaxID=656916 RepID=A0A2G7FEJ3_9EURO|nr:hypothetical protein AARAC_003611 [Aspergillus arachidicola]